MSFVALGLLFLTEFYLFSPAEIGGADWKFIEQDDEGLWIYDAETVECFSNHQIKVGTRKIYERKAVLAVVDKYGEKYENLDYVLAQWEIDCFQKKFKLCSAIFYSKENIVIEGYHAEKEGCLTPEDIPPESYLELLRKRVCR
jgi:hypothetical protein